MKTQNSLFGLSLAALALAGANAAGADTIATIGMSQTGTTFTFNGTTLKDVPLGGNLGVVGSQSLPNNPSPIYFSFGPITETSSVVNNQADFSGGSFVIYDSTQTLANTLLTGDFSYSQIDAGGTTGTVLAFDGVTYTGGSDLTAFLATHPGTGAIGGFSLSLSAVSQQSNGKPLGRISSAAAFPAFNAQGSAATFDATPTAVPEPDSLSLFGLGGAGLLGLTLRARKSRRTMA